MEKLNKYLYTDFYHDTINGTLKHGLRAEIPSISINSTTSAFIRLALVLILRAGYILIQIGNVPTENVYIILLQNIVDIAVSTSSFGLIGFILAYGNDALDGFVGYGMWIVSNQAQLDDAIFGFSACLIGTALMTTLLSSRLHFVGYLTISFLFSALYQPVIIHWVWHDQGWMHRRRFLHHSVSVKDHAGCLVVHLTASIAGLVGSIFLGRRLLKLKDIDESSIGTESPGSTITGYVFVALGLIAFSLPTAYYERIHMDQNFIAIILVNNVMAMSAGIIVVVALHFLVYHETFNYWIILRCMQGSIAGIVSISAGVDVYSPITSYLIAFLGAIIFYCVVLCLHSSAIEDYCNIISIHLICALYSAILPPLVGSGENLGFSVSLHLRLVHLGWQCMCCFVIILTTLTIFLLIFLLLATTGFLRNKSEEINHRRSLVATGKGPVRCFLQRIFTVKKDTPYIEPGSIGKSPDQMYKFEDERNQTFSADFKNESYKQKSKKYLDDFDTRDKFNQIRKSRFVYTVSTTKQKRLSELIHFEKSPEAAGDTDSKMYSPKIFKHDDAVLSLFRKPSFIELHKTKKCKNFVKNKHFYKFRQNKKYRRNVKSVGESILYDDQSNDGFIMTKAPPLDADSFSDLSDLEQVV